MASTQKISLFSGVVKASKDADAVLMNAKASSFFGFLKVSGYVSGTFTVKLQHSHNKVDWFDWVAFTAASGNTAEIKLPTSDKIMTYARASIVGAAVPNATLSIDLIFDN